VNRSNREAGKPTCAIGRQSPCFWSGSSFAEGIMASGPCAAPTGRRHGRTDQPSQNSQINLANGKPSRHGALSPRLRVLGG
jgi:hypothetical protein